MLCCMLGLQSFAYLTVCLLTVPSPFSLIMAAVHALQGSVAPVQCALTFNHKRTAV